MKIVAYYSLLAGLLLSLASCGKEKGNTVPTIFLTNPGPTAITMASADDSAVIVFHFVDGDGDLAEQNGVTLIDSRDTGVYKTYNLAFPKIPDIAKDPKSGGVEGDCALVLPSSQYFLPRGDTIHTKLGDTLSFRFYMTDAAGHQSNELSVGPIYLRP